MQIAEIAQIDKKRVKIRLEDGTCFALYKGEKRRYDLAEGEEVSEELYREICREVLIKRARKRTLYLLERMDRTESQLRLKLSQGYYPQDIIEDAIAYVKSYHYLDDLRYAQNYVRNQKDRKSQRKIQAELLGKGIAGNLVLQALQEEYQQENERDLILKWVEKKNYSSETADLKEKQRMYQFLMRKGFHSSDILHVLEHFSNTL
ncbi:regulatory protein RecX [Lachnospiraceae bacterium]|nr:regulatory protein RecX [Lachnospiraceae bacterium]